MKVSLFFSSFLEKILKFLIILEAAFASQATATPSPVH